MNERTAQAVITVMLTGAKAILDTFEMAIKAHPNYTPEQYLQILKRAVQVLELTGVPLSEHHEN